MNASEITGVIGGIVAASTTILGFLLAPKTIDAVLKYRRESHKLWMERKAAEREERAAEREAEDRRAAERKAQDERANVAAYKAMIARLEIDIADLKGRLDKSLHDSHECHATCAALKATNGHLVKETEELRAEVADLQARLARLESQA